MWYNFLTSQWVIAFNESVPGSFSKNVSLHFVAAIMSKNKHISTNKNLPRVPLIQIIRQLKFFPIHIFTSASLSHHLTTYPHVIVTQKKAPNRL